jgi:hypothetical protein
MADLPTPGPRTALSLAKQKIPDGICVQLDITDLLVLHPAWNDKQAWEFLDKHSAIVSIAMITAGIATVKALLESEGKQDEC